MQDHNIIITLYNVGIRTKIEISLTTTVNKLSVVVRENKYELLSVYIANASKITQQY